MTADGSGGDWATRHTRTSTWLLHKSVSEKLLRDRGDGRESGGCDDLGTDAPRVTDEMAVFAAHPGELRRAFDADAWGLRGELGEGEHLSGDLEHGGLGAEWKRLLRSGEREAVIAKRRGPHRPKVY
jgi:hypothetical protein